MDHSHFVTDYHSSVAALILINYTIFRDVEIFKTCFFKEHKFVKENIEFFLFLKLKISKSSNLENIQIFKSSNFD